MNKSDLVCEEVMIKRQEVLDKINNTMNLSFTEFQEGLSRILNCRSFDVSFRFFSNEEVEDVLVIQTGIEVINIDVKSKTFTSTSFDEETTLAIMELVRRVLK